MGTVTVKQIPAAKCSFCNGMALSGSDTCLAHAARLAERCRTERPAERFLYMGVLPHRQRHYWPDGKGQRHDG
jgi:hypothetical protein